MGYCEVLEPSLAAHCLQFKGCTPPENEKCPFSQDFIIDQGLHIHNLAEFLQNLYGGQDRYCSLSKFINDITEGQTG